MAGCNARRDGLFIGIPAMKLLHQFADSYMRERFVLEPLDA
jgi:hypothetical protein